MNDARHGGLRGLLLIATTAAAVTACGAPEGIDPHVEEAQSFLTDGTPEGVGVLRLLNDYETTLQTLDIDARMNKRAATRLIAHRDGADGVAGTRDDDLFDSIDEVDRVKYVGPAALRRLIAYAHTAALVPEGDEQLGLYDRVPFSVDEAAAALQLVNTATAEVLDDEVALNSRAVSSIVAGRPLESVLVLSKLYYVGGSALRRIKAFRPVEEQPAGPELGIISDLDKTVIPPQDDELSDPPYPGVAALYRALELRNGGQMGDIRFVTARDEERVGGVPEWLANHGVPTGPISTGYTGRPWAARREKVSDIEEILAAHPDQKFVLFGDTSHVDPEVYKEIVAAHPERILAVFIHKVTRTVGAGRTDGFHLIENYAQAAAITLAEGLLDEATVRAILETAQAEGLDLSNDEITQLIEDHRP